MLNVRSAMGQFLPIGEVVFVMRAILGGITENTGDDIVRTAWEHAEAVDKEPPR